MAKSGQRRAFEDEAIQAQAPTEELRVTDRKAMDITANLDAEYNRAGTFFNPDFFNSLAEISSDIHGMRRTDKYYDAQMGRLITQSDYNAEEKAYGQELKNKADLNVFDEKMSDARRIEKARLDAKNRGQNFAEVVPQLQIQLEDQIDEWAKTSPYVSEQLNKYKEETYIPLMKDAIKSDGEMNQAKALVRVQAYGDIVSNDIIQGRITLDNAIAGLGNMVLPLAQVAQVKGEVAMNSIYNQIMKNQLAGVEGDVKNSNISVDEGKQKILGLLTNYRTKQIKGVREDYTDFAEGKQVHEEETYQVWLDQETLDAAQTLMGNLDKYKPKISTIGVAEDYLTMLDYKTWKDGDNFDKSPYLRGTSLPKLRDDWWKARVVLAQAVKDGDPNAAAKLYEVDTAYFKARQVVLAANFLNRLNIDTGNDLTARTKLTEIQNALLHDLNKGNVGQFRNVPSYLVLDNGTNIINLGFPNDADFEDYMRRSPGQDLDTMKYNYYKDMYNVLTKVITQDVTSDKVSMLDPAYSEFTNKVDQMLVPQNLVSTDAKGHVVVNLNGVNQLAQLMQQGEQIGMKANNGAYIGAPTSAILESFTTKVNAMTPEIKAVAIRAYAEACIKAGNYGGLLDSMMNTNLSNGARAVVQQASVYALMAGDPSLKAHMGNVSDLQISKTFTDLTVGGAQEQLKGHGFASFSASLEQKMAQEKVPAEFKPAVRAAASQLYLADLEKHLGDKNYGRYKVSSSLLDKLISSNFKGGAYIHSSALRGVNVDELVNNANTSKSQVKTGLQKLGVKPGDVDTRINYQAKAEEVYVAGQPLYMTGRGSSLTGSGLQPFMLYFDNKPASMPQGKYDAAHTALLTGATSLSAASDIRSSSKMQDVLAKKGKGMNVDTFENLTYQMMNTAADPEVQRDWYNYYNSNFENTSLVNAPDGAKDVLVDIYGQGFWENFKTGGGKGAMTRNQLSHYIDFLYTRMQNGRSSRLDIAPSTYVQGKGVPISNIKGYCSSTRYGWQITCLRDGHSKYVYENGVQTNRISHHYNKTAGDLGLTGGFNRAFNSQGLLQIAYMDDFVNNIVKPMVTAGECTKIQHGFKELATDPRYAKYRSMKGKDGKPLFEYIPYENRNHFHVEFSEPWTEGKPTTKNPASPQFIRDTANVIKTNVQGIYNMQDAKACAVQGMHYTATEADAKRMNKPLSVLNSNAAYRAQAYANRFAYYRNAFRSTNFAVAAMAGCRFEIIDQKVVPGMTGRSTTTYSSVTGGNSQIPKSVRLPQGPLSADKLVQVLNALPYGSVRFKYYESDFKKANQALNTWVKDGK